MSDGDWYEYHVWERSAETISTNNIKCYCGAGPATYMVTNIETALVRCLVFDGECLLFEMMN